MPRTDGSTGSDRPARYTLHTGLGERAVLMLWAKGVELGATFVPLLKIATKTFFVGGERVSIEKAPLRPIRNLPPRFNHKRMRRRCAARVFQYIVWHPRPSGMTRRKCLTTATTTTHQNNARCIDVRCSASLGNNPDNMRGGWMLLVVPFPT